MIPIRVHCCLNSSCSCCHAGCSNGCRWAIIASRSRALQKALRAAVWFLASCWARARWKYLVADGRLHDSSLQIPDGKLRLSDSERNDRPAIEKFRIRSRQVEGSLNQLPGFRILAVSPGQQVRQIVECLNVLLILLEDLAIKSNGLMGAPVLVERPTEPAASLPWDTWRCRT